MKVQNKGGKGNPYHDEEGKFAEGDFAQAARGELTEGKPDADSFDSAFDSFVNSFDSAFDDFLNSFGGETKNEPTNEGNAPSTLDKNIEELTDQELSAEIKYHKAQCESQIDFSDWLDGVMFGGNKRTQCANLRQLSFFCKTFEGFNTPLPFEERSQRTPTYFFYSLGRGNSTDISKLKLKMAHLSSSTVADAGAEHDDQTKYAVDFGSRKDYFRGLTTLIRFNFSYMSRDYFAICNDQKYSSNPGWLFGMSGIGNKMPCDEKYMGSYTLSHEFGHVIENSILYNKGKGTSAQIIKSDILKICQQNTGMTQSEICRLYLSGYGHTNNHEFFAECFANAFCGKPNQLGKAMIEYLRRNVSFYKEEQAMTEYLRRSAIF